MRSRRRGAAPSLVRCLGSAALVLVAELASAESLAEIAPRPRAAVELPAPGWGELAYPAPRPGTYELPPLGEAGDGAVLDSFGNARRLHELFAGRVVVLAFIYSSCADTNGCPLAAAVMHGLFEAMQDHPRLGEAVRLISLSFDPQRDTPQRLRLYAKGLTGRTFTEQWQFVTTAAVADLAPILAAYGQAVQVEKGPDGISAGAFAHVLRVFLIDPQRRIRNVYSASFLHRDLLLSDLRTLLLEGSASARPATQAPGDASKLSGAGDDKAGYENPEYATRSRSPQGRKGRRTDLLAIANDPPLGLPPVPVPADNPLTEAKIALGRALFFDRRLSLNDTFSCAMCHIPEQGYTSNEMATAVGIEGRTVRRNSPTLLNVAYAERLFHDARETSLEQQVWSPLLAPNEMGNASIGTLLEKLQRLPEYQGAFEKVFGRPPNMETVGMALASYERTLLAGDSPFDLWYFGGKTDALTAAARRGFELFRGKAGCAACHRIAQDHALFTDHKLHNTGIGYRRAMGGSETTRRILVAPGTYLEVESSVIEAVAETPPGDMGRYEITQDPADRWKYRTPTLRNIALTAPYMHDGSFSTLREVVDFYDGGGIANENLSPQLRPLGLTPGETDDLVAFLETLTSSGVDRLVADAFAAEIGDPRPSDAQPRRAYDAHGGPR